MPSAEDALFSFTFRDAVCAYALALRWLKEGRHDTAQPARSGTISLISRTPPCDLLDGLITEDRKLEGMCKLARWIHECILDVFG